MYPDKKFLVDDPDAIRAFIEKNPLATLVAIGHDGRYAATHVPLLVQQWDDKIVFRGHVMRQTDHWFALKHAPSVFVCFLGPDAPILASWQLTSRFGGSWNYQAVHAQATMQWRTPEDLVAHLQQLKDHFETSPDHRFASLPEDYITALTPHIECVDVVVSHLQCIFKLSQNRRVEEFDLTVDNLRLKGGKSALVAEEMHSLRQTFYSK